MSERSDDDDIDDASLRSMRAVWLSMREEEPPAAGMSALLAAARDQAEQMRAQPTWWQRVFAQLRRPPALAFATVMLLIGGAVLVTRSADKQVESMTADDAPEMHSRDVERQLGAPTAVPPDPVEQANAEPVVTPEPPAPAKDVVAAKPPSREKPKPQKPRAVAEEAAKNEPDRYQRFEGDAPKTGFSEGNATDTTVMESPGTVGQAPTPGPPAEKKPAAKGATGEKVTLTDDGRVSTPPNEQLARQAESAASRGDCAAVRVIVARMKKQDESFYKTRLGKNAAVTKCL